ncbi:MAG: TonB-dependent receptor [candidate division Zixibacteria bacterium]|nr:TonB-dependent receptor [candidate division Zixibacteria bacterium]
MKTKIQIERMAVSIFPALGIVLLLGFTSVVSGQTLPSPSELKRLSVEELMNIEVTSVSKRPEKLLETASAIQVITQEEISRSGASSLPEALRLAPNLGVAQVNSNQWAISARGFNNTLTNKLLVLVDGRTIYTPLYAGVFWDIQSVLLEDLDRIEVVSGPGSMLWGSNAVNGVINIVTKSARETQGLYVSGAIGSLLQDFGAARYGGRADSNLFFRVYGQRFDHNATVFSDGSDGRNDWDLTQAGLRLDYYPSDENVLTVQGDLYGGFIERSAPGHTAVDGQNLLGRWTHTRSPESEFLVQVYFDRTWRIITNSFAEELQTYDLDFQYGFPLGESHRVMSGAGYRLMRDKVTNSASLAFLPPHRDLQLFSAFLQDEIILVPELLKFTTGLKLENNDYSGFEIQPSGRMAWTPDQRKTIWGAISRAVRSPSRIDEDFFVPNPLITPGTPILAGSPDFSSEEVIAYELGGRIQPVRGVSLSLATFFNHYDDLRSLEAKDSTTYEFRNGLEGESWGLEFSGSFQAMPWWRLRGGYTYLQVDLRQKPGHTDVNQARGEGNDPHNRFLIQSSMDFPAKFRLDITTRYVDILPYPSVPSYFTFDARVSWQFDRFDMSVVGRDLWESRHPEFGAAGTRQEIPRSIYGMVTCRY